MSWAGMGKRGGRSGTVRSVVHAGIPACHPVLASPREKIRRFGERWAPGEGSGTDLGGHVGDETGADRAGLRLAEVDLLDVELVGVLVLGRLEHLADAHVDELVDGRPLGGVVRHGAHRDARGGDARGDATRRGRTEGRGGGEGVHGAESEGHP